MADLYTDVQLQDYGTLLRFTPKTPILSVSSPEFCFIVAPHGEWDEGFAWLRLRLIVRWDISSDSKLVAFSASGLLDGESMEENEYETDGKKRTLLYLPLWNSRAPLALTKSGKLVAKSTITVTEAQPTLKGPERRPDFGAEFLRELLGPHSTHFFPGSEPAGPAGPAGAGAAYDSTEAPAAGRLGGAGGS